jgi:hypothetical protein
MREGLRHLVQCHCVLPQYRKRKDPVFHKFLVFSILENDITEEKLVQCSNCGVIHRVFDICKSEVYSGKDESLSVNTIEDIKISIPDKLLNILESYSCEIHVYENIKFILEEKSWKSKVKLTSEEIEGKVSAKFLQINGYERYSMVNETGQNFIGD